MMLSFEEIELKAERGDAEAQYQYAFALANLPQAERNPMLVVKLVRLAAQNGCEFARQLICSCGADLADEFIQSADYSFSMSILEDIVFTACLEAGIYNWDKVNEILAMHEGE